MDFFTYSCSTRNPDSDTEWGFFNLFVALSDVVITCIFNILAAWEGPLPGLHLGSRRRRPKPGPLRKEKGKLKLRRGSFKKGSWPPLGKPLSLEDLMGRGERCLVLNFILLLSVPGDLENRTFYSNEFWPVNGSYS